MTYIDPETEKQIIERLDRMKAKIDAFRASLEEPQKGYGDTRSEVRTVMNGDLEWNYDLRIYDWVARKGTVLGKIKREGRSMEVRSRGIGTITFLEDEQFVIAGNLIAILENDRALI